MSTVSAQAIEDSLKQCMDPEVPLNIVEMGLIYGIDVTENNDVNIKMTMTTQGCPLHQTLVADATRFAKKRTSPNQITKKTLILVVSNPDLILENILQPLKPSNRLQLLSGVIKPRHNRSNWNIFYLSDLFVRKLLD